MLVRVRRDRLRPASTGVLAATSCVEVQRLVNAAGIITQWHTGPARQGPGTGGLDRG